MASRLHWRGREIKARAVRAAKIGIDETMADCVEDAKTYHPWQNVTGLLEGSIQMRPAQEEGHRVVGRWGSFSVEYAIYQELGTIYMAPNPFLRPAADMWYPELADRIRDAFELGG